MNATDPVDQGQLRWPVSGRRTLDTALAGPFGPSLLAVAFALLSVPFVAASLARPLGDGLGNMPAVAWSDRLGVALVSTVASAVVGGTLGGLLVRSRPRLATLVAIGTAWPVGISLLPIAAAAWGNTLEIGAMCFASCEAVITQKDGWTGLSAYLSTVGWGFVFVLPVVLGAMLLGMARAPRSGLRVWASCLLVVGGYGALHAVSLVEGGGVAFVCLGVGVLVWTRVLVAPAPKTEDGRRAPF